MLLSPAAIPISLMFRSRLAADAAGNPADGLHEGASARPDAPTDAALSRMMAERRMMPVRFDYDARGDIRYSVFPVEAVARIVHDRPDLCEGLAAAVRQAAGDDRLCFMAGRDGTFHMYLDDSIPLHQDLLDAARSDGWTIAFCRRENDLIDLGGGPSVSHDPRPGFRRHASELREIPPAVALEAILSLADLEGPADETAPGPRVSASHPAPGADGP